MCREININFECYYIYENGTIFSKYWNKQLIGCLDKDGYTFVKLKLKNGKYDQFRLHRVIWVYFNGEIPSGLEIDHITPLSNGGTNELSNLRLVTPKENSNNINTKTNIRNSLIGKPHPMPKNGLLSKPVVRVTSDGKVIEYPSARECGRNGISQSAVCKCCNGGYYYKGKWFAFKQYKGDKYYWKSDYECIK